MDDNYRSDRLNQICLDDSRRSLLFHDFKIYFLITVVTGMQVQCSTSAPKHPSDEVVFLGPGPMQYVFERWAIGAIVWKRQTSPIASNILLGLYWNQALRVTMICKPHDVICSIFISHK